MRRIGCEGEVGPHACAGGEGGAGSAAGET
jgi:hypothetical protein